MFADQLAQLKSDCPGVPTPGPEYGPPEFEDDDEDWEPTETEMADAYDAFTSLPPLPENASA